MSHSDWAEAMRATAELTSADEAMVARVQARVAAGGVARSPWRRVLPLAAVLVAGIGTGVAWWSSQEPVLEQVGDLLQVDGIGVARLAGEGAPALVDGRLRVDWVVGRLELLAEQAVPVEVVTREGLAVAERGGLVVVRDALGSHVQAAAEAQVVCGEEAVVVLGAGEVLTCLPTTPSGLLGRAHALVERGAHADALAAVEAGLALAPAGAVAVELMTAGMEVALATQDLTTAVAFAERALEQGPTTRDEELHRVAARGWLLEGDCARALPHLDAMASLDDAEAQHQARCRGE